MSGRMRALFWLLAALLLVWIGVATLHALDAERCAAEGGLWQWSAWRCKPAGQDIFIGRELHRI